MSPRKQPLSPRTNELDITPCPRAGMTPSEPKFKPLRNVITSSNLDLGKVVSPVGQYIKSNPLPPIVRQIRPKVAKVQDLADFVTEQPIQEKKRYFKPLPMAEYRSSRVALEQQIPSKDDDMKALPKVFGMAPSV